MTRSHEASSRRDTGCCRLELRKLRIERARLVSIVSIGIPAGLQSVVFSLSNVLIQSSINSFGDTVMAGNTAASNIDGFIYIAMNAFYHAAISFAGQNYGAREFGRVKTVCRHCLVLVTVVGILISAICFLFGRDLLWVYTDSPAVIDAGMIRLIYVGLPYFFCGTMEVMSGMLRGIGYSVTSMIVSLLGACVFRVIWIYTVFASFHSIEWLYLSYPISWLITTAASYLCYKIIYARQCSFVLK